MSSQPIQARPRPPSAARSPALGEQAVVWVLWLTYGSFYFCRTNIAAAVPGLQADLHLDKEQIGQILAILKVTYGTGQLINGQLAERLSPRVLLASGHGAVVDAQSGVRDGDFLVALDVTAGRRGEGSEARVRMASLVDRDWLSPTHTAFEHWIDESSGVVRAAERDHYGAIVLTERPTSPDPVVASRLLAEAFALRGLSSADEQLVRRLRFAGIDLGDRLVRRLRDRQGRAGDLT